ncbi:hypothetical protein [Methylobacterium pseudosasicola]|uniref:Phage DNA packaging protein, Nu1 subunit of terminase n=1 Tax=Methylobacterium pseudosasicola TaxID=582667 RepID=A0A1I4N3L0_9HYPH|nr:hypothetical protein [Methylobacterium pseudosasicola]SFM09926.1 Phage DNA packaging protein, Nu1 subunit of terminase [Methylobacterium pseudosasicola]
MATIAELAEHIALSERRIYELQAKGVISKAKPGAIDLAEARLSYIRHLRENASGRVPTGDLDPSQELARKNRALAIQTEMRNDLAIGKIVLADVAIASQVLLCRKLKNKFQGLPSRAAPRGVHMKTTAELQGLLAQEVDLILTELGDGDGLVSLDEVKAEIGTDDLA